MRAVLIAALVLGIVQTLVRGAQLKVDVTLKPNGVDSCYACAYGDTPTNDTISWILLPTDASNVEILLGQIYMPSSGNDSISYSEAICCKYIFAKNELATLALGTLQAVNFTFNRWATYGNEGKPDGVIDYVYGFGIYDSAGDELIHNIWTLPDNQQATAPRISSNPDDYYEGHIDTTKTNGNDNLGDIVYMLVGYQVINTAQDAEVKYANVSVTLIIEITNNDGTGFGVGFGVGVPVVFLAVFLPVYFCVIKPKMQKKMESKAMEMGKSPQNSPSNTHYGAISGTASATSTGSGSLLGGNYSPLGPTSNDAVSSASKPSTKGEMHDRFNIPYREIAFKREIGAGGFGKVFMGEWQSTEVAIKVSNNATSNDEFRKEAELMVNIRPHPNVLQVLGVCTDGVSPAIIMEYCSGGSLDLLMFDKSKPVTEEYQFRLILGIARGMLHLHKNNIVHRDLAARNILLSRDGEPKISDFGMSRIIESTIKEGTTRTNVGPIRWMAPESIKSKVYSTKSDVWSFGVVISEILNREEPHKEIEDVIEVAIAIRNELKTPKINPDAPELLKDIMQLCWAINPEERPEMDALCDKLNKYKDQKNL